MSVNPQQLRKLLFRPSKHPSLQNVENTSNVRASNNIRPSQASRLTQQPRLTTTRRQENVEDESEDEDNIHKQDESMIHVLASKCVDGILADMERLSIKPAYKPIPTRLQEALDTSGQNELERGHAIMHGILRDIERYDETRFRRSKDQRIIHHKTLGTCARTIFGPIFNVHEMEICERYGFESTKQAFLIRMPRRGGKSVGVAQLIVPLMRNVPNITILVIAPTLRAASSDSGMMSIINTLFSECFQTTRFEKKTQTELFLKVSDTDVRKLFAYSGKATSKYVYLISCCCCCAGKFDLNICCPKILHGKFFICNTFTHMITQHNTQNKTKMYIWVACMTGIGQGIAFGAGRPLVLRQLLTLWDPVEHDWGVDEWPFLKWLLVFCAIVCTELGLGLLTRYFAIQKSLLPFIVTRLKQSNKESHREATTLADALLNDVMFIYQLPFIVSAIISNIYVLATYVGASSGIGIGLMLFLVMEMMTQLPKYKQAQERWMEHLNARLNLMRTFLADVEVNKMIQAETLFYGPQTKRERMFELAATRVQLVILMSVIGLIKTSSLLATSGAFLYLSYEDPEITPRNVFAAITAFQGLRMPFMFLGPMIAQWKILGSFMRCTATNVDVTSNHHRTSMMQSSNELMVTTTTKDEYVMPNYVFMDVRDISSEMFQQWVLNKTLHQAQAVYVPTTPWLFRGTILDNIHVYFPQGTSYVAPNKLVRSILGSDLKNFKQVCGERGTMVSGGQRQRIALARAVHYIQNYSGCCFLALDDSLTALNPEMRHYCMRLLEKHLPCSLVVRGTNADYTFLMQQQSFVTMSALPFHTIVRWRVYAPPQPTTQSINKKEPEEEENEDDADDEEEHQMELPPLPFQAHQLAQKNRMTLAVKKTPQQTFTLQEEEDTYEAYVQQLTQKRFPFIGYRSYLIHFILFVCTFGLLSFSDLRVVDWMKVVSARLLLLQENATMIPQDNVVLVQTITPYTNSDQVFAWTFFVACVGHMIFYVWFGLHEVYMQRWKISKLFENAVQQIWNVASMEKIRSADILDVFSISTLGMVDFMLIRGMNETLAIFGCLCSYCATSFILLPLAGAIALCFLVIWGGFIYFTTPWMLQAKQLVDVQSAQVLATSLELQDAHAQHLPEKLFQQAYEDAIVHYRLARNELMTLWFQLGMFSTLLAGLFSFSTGLIVLKFPSDDSATSAMLLIISLLIPYYGALLSQVAPQMVEALHAQQRLYDLSLPQEVSSGGEKLGVIDPLEAAMVDFQAVCVGPILHPFSFTFQKRACVLMRGASGSGKSTLARALLGRVTLDTGSIFVNGIHASSIPLPILRSYIAYVPQHPVRFSGLVRSQFLEPNVDLLENVLNIPMNVDVSTLTEAQAHRLSLARILHRTINDYGMLILDEPTALCESPTEEQIIWNLLQTVWSTKTRWIISHRDMVDVPVDVKLYVGKNGMITQYIQ